MVIQNITGTYNLVADPEWKLLQLYEIYMECNTTSGPVTINLFPINDLGFFWNVKIYVVDQYRNSATNNITVNCSAFDTFGGSTTQTINTDGGSLCFAVTDNTTWLVTGGSGGGIKDYKQAQLPNVSLNPQTIARPDLFGEGLPYFPYVGTTPFIRLNNNTLVNVQYCQSILPNGILIFECYSFGIVEPINGYWVAFKQNASNPKLLEKVAELKMTNQFWNQWYNYTLKDEGENVVKFVNLNFPDFNGVNNIQSWTTKLTYNDGVLTAEDSTLDLNKTYLQLYNELAGTDLGSGAFDNRIMEYILDDDYYGMNTGTQKGWLYYRSNAGAGAVQWWTVGVNILTGQTRFITPAETIFATVTNFDFSTKTVDDLIQQWVNHPNGVMYSFADNNFPNNYNNVNGVTCVWSPYFQNPNQVLYINSRFIENGQFEYLFGQLSAAFLGYTSLYWDNKNIFTITYDPPYFSNGQTLVVQRFNTDTKEVKTWNIPILFEITSQLSIYENNQGVLIFNFTRPGEAYFYTSFGLYTYIYAPNSNDYYWQLQSNNCYPTNLLLDKSWSTNYDTLLYNPYSVGVEVDTHTGVNFSNN